MLNDIARVAGDLVHLLIEDAASRPAPASVSLRAALARAFSHKTMADACLALVLPTGKPPQRLSRGPSLRSG